MNWEALKGSWTQLRGRIRMQWGRLTDDQLDVIEGRRDLLLGKLQETYGVTEEEADAQVTAWENAEFGDGTSATGRPDEARRAV
ncbi:MAG TPA: CsbD family protein [Steroidobacteraceae bacterium]|nr:CsbD family protein [Steroidobacteraceae bacterium]